MLVGDIYGGMDYSKVRPAFDLLAIIVELDDNMCVIRDG